MKKKKGTIRSIKKRQAVKLLREELAKAIDAFGFYGIEEGAGEAQSVAAPSAEGAEHLEDGGAPDDGNDGDYEEDGTADPTYEDPEEIQVAIDTAISALMNKGFLEAEGGAPSLSDVCGALFGRESDLTKQAHYFEELTNGYEGRASTEDLREAYNVLQSMIEELKPKKKPK